MFPLKALWEPTVSIQQQWKTVTQSLKQQDDGIFFCGLTFGDKMTKSSFLRNERIARGADARFSVEVHRERQQWRDQGESIEA